MSEEQQRAKLVAEAIEWQHTPYHPEARVKGAGADCLTFLEGAFENAGLIEPIAKLPHYSKDWHMNKPEPGKEAEAELYMNAILRYCDEVAAPPERAVKPGDLVLWRMGWTFSHGAIVVDWPRVIHAYTSRPVSFEDAERAGYLTHIFEVRAFRNQPRPRRFFALKGWT
jgi:cell wall-associated NlpC family hydrolase